ncbi:hypothetical protein BCR32DRAFT_271585 [Anaeromyces robustus]|uniref:Uncharacterized protein n=1 Tax=Anaeromyces robustus TaxID=1754192 RepID=A0A1Y1WR50_9FUNG|nr:hypothetical protein BCR32DRAFT_271585 [Anaeromyces robustus]|eukprot:ORX75952.1 hypothetical protein BCR32DRAFT_271585 [Anaeromyces robustus]
MLSEAEIATLWQTQGKYFIENGSGSYMDWLTSKGTNFTCYIQYLNSLDDEKKIGNVVDTIRVILYSIHKPFKFLFFYWTIVIFILHKFNFKKPVVKIILAHFLLRASGDTLDKLGGLWSTYHVNSLTRDETGKIIEYGCKSSGNIHPFNWFLTRQIGTICWYVGEMFGDWYPLLRTKAVIRNQRKIIIVYVACGIFNLSKLALIILHFTFSPTELYDKNGEYAINKANMFYFTYWMIQLSIIYASFFYDFSVFYVLKKNIFNEIQMETGFVKNFKTISEYRILVSAIISVVFLPIVSITIILKYYYYFKYNYSNLNFSFDDIRQSIANVQYYMIFIDQILLLRSHGGSSISSSSQQSTNNNSKIKYNKSSNNLSLSGNNSNNNFKYQNLNNNSSYMDNKLKISDHNYYPDTNRNYNDFNFGTLTNNKKKNYLLLLKKC